MTENARASQPRARWRVPVVALVSAAVLVAGTVLVAGATGGVGRRTGSDPAAATSRSTRAGRGASAVTGTGGNLTTYGFSNSRDGVDTVDRGFGSPVRAWDRSVGSKALDGPVYGQPLVDHGVVIVGTENDTVYAIAARNGAILWKHHLATAVSAAVAHTDPNMGCGDIFPLGITGTPVIDATKGIVFVAAEIQTPRSKNYLGIQHWLYALRVSNGSLVFSHRIDPYRDYVSYDGTALQQRGTLTLANGYVYVPFGGLYGDCGDYHGYMVGLRETGKAAMTEYEVPTAREGAIWETNGAAVGPGGDLFVATGNGSCQNAFDHGNSVIELYPNLKERGFFAPTDWHALSCADLDLGSAGPLVVPGTSVLFEAGKTNENGKSVGYLVQAGHLGGIGHSLFEGSVCQSGGSGDFGANAAWQTGSGSSRRTYVFAACTNGIEALSVSIGSRKSFNQAWHVSQASPNGPPIIVRNLLYSVQNGMGDGPQYNTLFVIDPTTGHVVHSVAVDPVEHFAPIGAGDGMLFVPTVGGVEAFRS